MLRVKAWIERNLIMVKVGEEKSSKIAVPWEKRFLHLYNNTLVGMIFILLVVLVNITLSIISLFYTNKEFDAVDMSFSIYFILELSLRLYCQKQVDGSVSSFFKSIFNCIDALLVAIDWTLFFSLIQILEILYKRLKVSE